MVWLPPMLSPSPSPVTIQTLSSAQSAYSQARHRFVLSQLLLRQSAGQVGEADLRLVNALLQ